MIDQHRHHLGPVKTGLWTNTSVFFWIKSTVTLHSSSKFQWLNVIFKGLWGTWRKKTFFSNLLHIKNESVEKCRCYSVFLSLYVFTGHPVVSVASECTLYLAVRHFQWKTTITLLAPKPSDSLAKTLQYMGVAALPLPQSVYAFVFLCHLGESELSL